MGNDINDVQLKIFFLQQQVLVLAMYVDELLSQFPCCSQCNRCVIDESAALAVGLQLSSKKLSMS